MKIKKLIKKLKQFDENLDICVYHPELENMWDMEIRNNEGETKYVEIIVDNKLD
tara:strand:- start:827 stop:988 length:162 start_codon:yes stop_codon:yes gene_type:complete